MRIFLIGFLFLMAQAGFVAADTLTMTTYYPSPSGSYQTLTTTGNIGIGTTAPRGNLEVNGSVFIRSARLAAGYALCMTASHVLGHCTSITTATGACTCVTP